MTIDGKNIKEEYGCTLLWGSYDTLLKFPQRKPVSYNDWAESNGIEADLSEVEFESKKVQLTFLMETETFDQFWELYQKIYADLTSQGYHTLRFSNYLQYKLRYDSGSQYRIPTPFNIGNNLTSFTLDFFDDNPEIEISDNIIEGNTPLGLYKINEIDFGRFGIGADEPQDELLKYPSLKKPFTDGTNMYTDFIRTAHKEIRIPLWMIAKNEGEFLTNYKAFFSQLSQPGTQRLSIDSLGISTNVYYKDCTSFSIETWGKNGISARFTIVLVIPVIDWMKIKGSKIYKVLRDHKTYKILADRRGRAITFN